MKIGILTLPLHTNYGGILQAYALQTVLERMGHEVVIFNRYGAPTLPPFPKNLYYYSLRFIKKILGKPNIIIRKEYLIRREYPVVTKYPQRFIDQFLHCYWIDKICDIEKSEVDAIIVGSDQVWRPRYFAEMWHTSPSNSFLLFAESLNIKRYAYAASFGVDEWEYSQNIADELKFAAKKFDAISVREKTGVELCEKYLGVSADLVLDPTMLLTKEDYIKLINKCSQPSSQGDMFCYILDSTIEKEELIDRISRKKHLTPFYVKAKGIEKTSSIEERIHKPVEAWLRGFYDAKFVVTDSFHACVFSILFEKPFIVIGNKGRGITRFSSLLELFSLENHLIDSVSDYNPDIDYKIPETTRILLEEWRKKSISFLKEIR